MTSGYVFFARKGLVVFVEDVNVVVVIVVVDLLFCCWVVIVRSRVLSLLTVVLVAVFEPGRQRWVIDVGDRGGGWGVVVMVMVVAVVAVVTSSARGLFFRRAGSAIRETAPFPYCRMKPEER